VSDSLVAKGPRRTTEAPKEGYDPGRLRRAAVLAVKRLGPTRFHVAGQDEPHYSVDLFEDIPCYCKDAEFHGRGCKHELAARMANGDMALIQALGDMLLKSDKANKALAKQTRKLA
jgi:hypothetical protein